MPGTDLRSRAADVRWYHTIDLGNGVVTPGVDDTPCRLARLALPASLAGLSVLDIGAWDGFLSFEAKRRGARGRLPPIATRGAGADWGDSCAR